MDCHGNYGYDKYVWHTNSVWATSTVWLLFRMKGFRHEGPALVHDSIERASKFLLTGARKDWDIFDVAGSSRAEVLGRCSHDTVAL